MLDQAGVIARVQSMACASLDPILTDAEVADIVSQFKRATVWAASIAYALGDVVAPGDGRFYRCRTAGTSGSAFPTIDAHAYRGWITEGTVTWSDDGKAYPELWDISGAIGKAWELKASRAATYINTKAPGQMFDLEAVYKHCVAQAAKYRPVFVH